MPCTGANKRYWHEEGPFDLRGDPALLGRGLRSTTTDNIVYCSGRSPDSLFWSQQTKLALRRKHNSYE